MSNPEIIKNYEKLNELKKKHKKIDKELDQLYNEWEEVLK